MNYIILDLEWNQALNNAMIVRSPVVLYGEIIQIGAIKTDENFNFLDKINDFSNGEISSPAALIIISTVSQTPLLSES